MLSDFLRYPYVSVKNVRGKKCLFYRYLQLCPRGIFKKMLPEGATIWVIITSVLGHFKKFRKYVFVASNRVNNFVPEHISPKWPQNELSFKEFLEKSIECSRIDFNGPIAKMLRDFLVILTFL